MKRGPSCIRIFGRTNKIDARWSRAGTCANPPQHFLPPRAAQRALWVVTQMTPKKSEQLFGEDREHGPLEEQPGSSTKVAGRTLGGREGLLRARHLAVPVASRRTAPCQPRLAPFPLTPPFRGHPDPVPGQPDPPGDTSAARMGHDDAGPGTRDAWSVPSTRPLPKRDGPRARGKQVILS